MKPEKIILKFEDVAEQVHGSVRRLVGFVQAKSMLPLFDAADLEANPRTAKAGAVTAAIIDSIRNDPDIFPFKTKGVLVGASDYTALERRRYELRFEDIRLEGILDGGHNMLAIGTHILLNAVPDPRLERNIRLWDHFKREWTLNRGAINEIREDLTFLVPIEVLVPASLDDDAVVDDFRSELLEICAARNNNAELTSETKANQKGFYEAIKSALPPAVASRIEWKTNTPGGDVRVRDIIALAWIPLSKLDLPTGTKVPLPQNIYRNKGECAKLFGDLMGHAEVSTPEGSGPRVRLTNTGVESAIWVLGQIPELYDLIYLRFPHAFNSTGGRFGKLNIVRLFDPTKRSEKIRKYMKTAPLTHFTEQPAEYDYPDGLIMPLMWGLRALMTVTNGKVTWKTDPKAFIEAHLNDIARSYKLVLEMSRFDPQKIGKNEASYEFAESEFEKALLKQGKAAA